MQSQPALHLNTLCCDNSATHVLFILQCQLSYTGAGVLARRGTASVCVFHFHVCITPDVEPAGCCPTRHADGLEPEAYPLTLHQQQDLEAAAVYLYTTRALRFHPGFLGPAGRAELTVTTRDMHAGNRRPQHVLVRRAGPQMVGEAAAAGGALEVQLPQRVAYCYASPHEPGPTHDGGRYTPYLHHLVIDGRAMCLQVGADTLHTTLTLLCKEPL